MRFGLVKDEPSSSQSERPLPRTQLLTVSRKAKGSMASLIDAQLPHDRPSYVQFPTPSGLTFWRILRD